MISELQKENVGAGGGKRRGFRGLAGICCARGAREVMRVATLAAVKGSGGLIFGNVNCAISQSDDPLQTFSPQTAPPLPATPRAVGLMAAWQHGLPKFCRRQWSSTAAGGACNASLTAAKLRKREACMRPMALSAERATAKGTRRHSSPTLRLKPAPASHGNGSCRNGIRAALLRQFDAFGFPRRQAAAQRAAVKATNPAPPIDAGRVSRLTGTRPPR